MDVNRGYILKSSYGNDSVALIQWAKEHRLENVTVLYSDTGWASAEWPQRVAAGEVLCQLYGFRTITVKSMGFKELVRQKKSFPRQGIQFCTAELKVLPAQAVMDQIDPERKFTVLVGKRREESANRALTPEFVLYSALDQGRRLWQPLFDMKEAERNTLIIKTGMQVLDHRSMECFPCINSNRADLRKLTPARIKEIAEFEAEMGITGKGKPRTMFRPYRYMGATGIKEVVRWAESDPGKFDLDDGTGQDCYSGVCGI
jgi:3'-phosphoadenosine 5'-phosphosulfate sulfotransferase (PAPS reductase)/FAD synthetase